MKTARKKSTAGAASEAFRETFTAVFKTSVRSKDLSGVLNGILKTRSVHERVFWEHVRRCHRCDHVHELRGERVESCGACGAHFAPFFFAEVTPDVLSATESTQKPKPESLVLSKATAYRPLVGFTWWWSSDAMGDEPGEKWMPRA